MPSTENCKSTLQSSTFPLLNSYSVSTQSCYKYMFFFFLFGGSASLSQKLQRTYPTNWPSELIKLKNYGFCCFILIECKGTANSPISNSLCPPKTPFSMLIKVIFRSDSNVRSPSIMSIFSKWSHTGYLPFFAKVYLVSVISSSSGFFFLPSFLIF